MTKQKGLLNKIEFIEFLKHIKVDDLIIEKIEGFQDIIKVDNIKYYFYSYITPIDIDCNEYSFELNYYSFDEMEFLFSHKMFNDIENSIYMLYYYINNV